jgi:hypothetical protein
MSGNNFGAFSFSRTVNFKALYSDGIKSFEVIEKADPR